MRPYRSRHWPICILLHIFICEHQNLRSVHVLYGKITSHPLCEKKYYLLKDCNISEQENYHTALHNVVQIYMQIKQPLNCVC